MKTVASSKAAIQGKRNNFTLIDDSNDGLPEVPRPPSGSHIRTRAHFHRSHTNWVFVDHEEAGELPPERMELWVIHRNPPDYMGKYVVRHWMLTGSDRWVDHVPFAVTDTLEEARRAIQPTQRVNIGRFESEDVSVFEAWM